MTTQTQTSQKASLDFIIGTPADSRFDLTQKDYAPKKHLKVRDILFTKPFLEKALACGYMHLEGKKRLSEVENQTLFMVDPRLGGMVLQVELEDYREIKNEALEDLGFRLKGHEKVKSDNKNMFWLTFSLEMINALDLSIDCDFKAKLKAVTGQSVAVIRQDSLYPRLDRSGEMLLGGTKYVYLSSAQYDPETGEVYSSGRPKINPTTKELLTYRQQLIFSRTVLILAETDEQLPKSAYSKITHDGSLPLINDMVDENGDVSLKWVAEAYKDIVGKEAILSTLNVRKELIEE